MSNIVEKIKKIPNLHSLKGCTQEQIRAAEKELNLKFPAEFKEYVEKYGVISFYGTEWTGLNVKGYLNVVETTKEERKLDDNFPSGCFVLEDLGIDDILAIVDEDGKVYVSQYGKKELICNSLSEYLEQCIARKKG